MLAPFPAISPQVSGFSSLASAFPPKRNYGRSRIPVCCFSRELERTRVVAFFVEEVGHIAVNPVVVRVIFVDQRKCSLILLHRARVVVQAFIRKAHVVVGSKGLWIQFENLAELRNRLCKPVLLIVDSTQGVIRLRIVRIVLYRRNDGLFGFLLLPEQVQHITP